MADVWIAEAILHIDLTVPERVLSLHRRDIQVPVEQVRTMTAVPDVMTRLRGLRMPGAGVPGVLAIGTWQGEYNGATFHDLIIVHRPGPGVVISIDGGEYDRILLGSAQPQELIDELRR